MAPLTDDQLAAMGLAPQLSQGAPPIVSAAMPPAVPPILAPSNAAMPSNPFGTKAGVAPGRIIPQDTKGLGQAIYHAEKPQITADPGSLDYWKQRQNELEYNQAHPWGSPISAHPGIWGKIGHVAAEVGNIAGNAFEPGIMASIPGTMLHNQIEELQNLHGLHQAGILQNQTQEAEAQKERADTEAEREQRAEETTEQPKEEPVYDKDKQLIGFNVGGKLISKDSAEATPEMKAISGIAKEPPGKPAHITYDQGIPVSVDDGKGNVFDVNDPKLPAELKPIVQAATRAHGQREQEAESKEDRQNARSEARQARQFAQQEKMFEAHQNAPTTQQRNIASQAQLAAEGIPGVLQEIDRLGAKLGPISGRWDQFMQGRIGMEDPDFAGLRADLMMTASAVALAHARGRLPENLRQEFDHMINAPKQDPENLKATLRHILPWLQRAGAIGGEHEQGGNAPPAGARVRDYTQLSPK